MEVKFHKMHGLGNDFIIFKDTIDFEELSKDQVKFLCNRNEGIGCDQLIICKKDNEHVKMKIYNKDGSVALFCGNATRCVAGLYTNEESSDEKELLIETGNCLLPCSVKNSMVTVNIGPPVLEWEKIPLSVKTCNNELDLSNEVKIDLKGFCLNVGNPHIVLFVENHNFNLEDVGSKIENLHYFPEKINVNFAKIICRKSISLRVWERGAGLTLACGSGASASFYAAYKKKLVDNDVTVYFSKGFLNIKLENENILMTGQYSYVFNGYINI